MKLLVTGGYGFIGSGFIRLLTTARPDWVVYNVDKMTYSANKNNLKLLDDIGWDRHFYIPGDICDYQRMWSIIEGSMGGHVDAIVNFAAESHVDRSLKDPQAFARTNVLGVLNLLELMRKHGMAGRLVQISTDEVYGPAHAFAFEERHKFTPGNPYSASKASAEHLCQAYHNSYDIDVVITRGANTIGPCQYPEKIVPLFVTNALSGYPLPIYGTGLQSRDYTYLDDHCMGILLALEKGVSGQAYNIGAENYCRSIRVAEKVITFLEANTSIGRAEIKRVTDRAGHDSRYRMATHKIKELGWVANHFLDQALETTINWYLTNPWWWGPIRKSEEFQEYFSKQYPTLEKKDGTGTS
jgi:dTDP-glucose 4,6-dehydratase